MDLAGRFAVQEGRFDRFAIELKQWLLGQSQIDKRLFIHQGLPGGQASAGHSSQRIGWLKALSQPGRGLFLLLGIAVGKEDAGGFVKMIAIIMHPYQDILAGSLTQFREDGFNHDRWRKNLLETILEG